MTVNTTKKGITAVVAIVLLLMMTVAAAGLAYMWISSMQTDTQQKTTQQLNAQQQQMQGAFNVESVWGGPAPGNMVFSVRNTGTTAINFGAPGLKFYVNGVLTATPATLSGVGILEPGRASTAAITTTTVFPTAGGAATLKIVSAEGVTAEYRCAVTTSTQSTC